MTAKKKKLIKGLVAVALIAIIGIGATFAYLTGTTGTKSNIFSNSKTTVKPVIKEDTWDNGGKTEAEKYTPGSVISKDPTISLESNSESAYLGMKLSFKGDVSGYDTNTGLSTGGNFMTYEQFEKYAQYGSVSGQTFTAGAAAGWKKVAINKQGEELWAFGTTDASSNWTALAKDGGQAATAIFSKIQVNYGINAVSTSTSTTFYKKTTSYSVDKDGNIVKDEKGNPKITTTPVVVTKENMTDNVTYYDQDGNVVITNYLPKFAIDAQGYAVQSANVTPADGIIQMITLANQGKTAGSDDYFYAV